MTPCPKGSPSGGALIRSERLYHSHIEHWRKQQENGTLAASTGKPKRDADADELARLRAENKKLKAANQKLPARPGGRGDRDGSHLPPPRRRSRRLNCSPTSKL